MLEKILSSLLSRPAGYGVYVHWPYCTKICSYCNFNKYRLPVTASWTNKVDDEDDYYRSLQQCFEKQLVHFLHKARFPRVTSVYFGGGTPSLAPPSTISTIVNAIKREIGLVNGAEVTLEVNPTISSMEKLNEFKEAGINRVSIGVQSLNDRILKDVLYRDHTASEARRVIAEACYVFKGAVSVDMMFGLPEQKETECLEQLAELLSLYPQVNHVSLYQLTLERGTEMFKHVKNKKWALPSEDSVTACYEELIKLLAELGFVQYEISNFARDGFTSAHNQNYWLGGNYIGIGPGAHSCHQDPNLNIREWTRSVNMLTPAQWMKEINNAGGSKEMALAWSKSVSNWDRFEEILCSSLRTNVGFTKPVCDYFGVDFRDLIDLMNCKLEKLVSDGFIATDGNTVKVPGKGKMVLDSILPIILTELQKFNYYNNNNYFS